METLDALPPPGPTVKLISDLPVNELFETIFYLARQGEVCKRALGFYLLDMQKRGVSVARSYPSTTFFIETVLRLSPKEANSLLRVARDLEALPGIDEAFSKGEIGWCAVREITRVATPETEMAWLEFAKGRTVREIEPVVTRAKKGQLPGEGRGTPRVRIRIQYLLAPEVHKLWDALLAKTLSSLPRGSTPNDAVKEIAERMLANWPLGGEEKGATGAGEAVYMAVIHTNRDGTEAWVEGDEGEIPVDPGVVEELKAEGKAEVIETSDVDVEGEASAIRFGERGKVPREERAAPATQKEKRSVSARDGHRCRICGGRRGLHRHHIDSVGDGGESRIERLVLLCRRCHGAVHDHLILLSFNGKGRLIPLDQKHEPLRKTGGLAELLKDASDERRLSVIERVEPAEPEEAGEAGKGAPEEVPRETMLRLRRRASRAEGLAFATARDHRAVPKAAAPRARKKHKDRTKGEGGRKT